MHPRARNLLAAIAQRGWAAMAIYGSIGPQDRLGRRFLALGEGSLLCFPTGVVFGENYMRIGKATLFGPSVCMSVGMLPGQRITPTAPDGSILRIGDRCAIGRGSQIVAHRSIDIGDDVITGPNCYVTDQNHAYSEPDVPISRQWPSEAPVSIGSGSWLGVGAVVLPGTHLGRNSVVAAGAIVHGTYPDNAVLAGVPAKVVRTYDPEHGWQPSMRDLNITPPAGWEPEPIH